MIKSVNGNRWNNIMIGPLIRVESRPGFICFIVSKFNGVVM